MLNCCMFYFWLNQKRCWILQVFLLFFIMHISTIFSNHNGIFSLVYFLYFMTHKIMQLKVHILRHYLAPPNWLHVNIYQSSWNNHCSLALLLALALPTERIKHWNEWKTFQKKELWLSVHPFQCFILSVWTIIYLKRSATCGIGSFNDECH